MSTTVKISDLLEQPVVVKVGKGSLTVRALSLSEIVQLLMSRQEEFLSIYAEGSSAKPNYTKFLLATPDMVADILSLAMCAPGQQADIKKLPGTVQLTALAETWRLSVPDPKALKESLSVVMAELRELSSNEKVKQEIAPAKSSSAG